MGYSSILFLLVTIFLSGCEPREAVDSSAEEAKPETVKYTAPAETDAGDTDLAEPDPLVFDSFEDMEYIFNYKNDTTYVINFWATWCGPCVRELPYFYRLHEEFKDQKVKIILVSLDFPKQIESKLIPFIKENNVEPEVMVLTDGNTNSWISKVDEKWEGAIPVTLVYNKDNRDFLYGELPTYRKLRKKVENVININ